MFARTCFVAIAISALAPAAAIAEFRVPECDVLAGLPLNALPAAIERGEGDAILEPVLGVRAAKLTSEIVEAAKQASRDCRLPVTFTQSYFDRAWAEVLSAGGRARDRETDGLVVRRNRSAGRRELDRHSPPLRMGFLRVAKVCVRERYSFRPADLTLMESSIRSYIADRRVVEHVVQASWKEAQRRLNEAWPAFGRALCAGVRDAAIQLFREDADRTALNLFID